MKHTYYVRPFPVYKALLLGFCSFFLEISIFEKACAQDLGLARQSVSNVGGNFYFDDVVADASGNSYLIGTSNTAPGSITGTPFQGKQIYFVKHNSAGAYVGARAINGIGNFNHDQTITLDNSGNVYIAGAFYGTNVNFGTPLVPRMASSNCGLNTSCYTAYVAKYNSVFDCLWVRAIPVTGTYTHINAVDTDNSTGDVYAIGTQLNTTTFASSIFLYKYDAAGTLQWQKSLGTGEGGGVDFDGGSAYVTGTFSGTNNFGGATSFNSNSGAAFISKYNSSGTFQAATQVANTVSGSGGERGNDIVVKNSRVYFTGNGSYNSVGITDRIFIAVLTTSLTTDPTFGSPIVIGNGSTKIGEGKRIDADAAGNIYVMGSFNGAGLSFSPKGIYAGTTNTSLTSPSSRYNAFFVQYSDNGLCKAARNFSSGSSYHNYGSAVAYSSSNNTVYLTGTFANSMTITSCIGNNTTLDGNGTAISSSETQGYLLYYSANLPILTVATSDDRMQQPSNYTYHTATVQQPLGGSTDYKWYEEVNGQPTTLIATGVQLNRWPIPPCATKYYQLQVTTGCNLLVYRGYAYNTYGCSGSFAYVAYPNPAASELNIQQMAEDNPAAAAMLATSPAEVTDQVKVETGKERPYEAKLINPFGEVLKTGRSLGENISFDLSDLPPGIYALHIDNGKEVVRKQVQIRR